MTQQHPEQVAPMAKHPPSRIVPLAKETTAHLAEAAPQKLVYHGGPLLANVKIFTTFWGAAWKTAAQQKVAHRLNDFFTFIVTSPLIDQLAEYSVPGFKIGHGSFLGTATVDTQLPHLLTDAEVRQRLQQQIAGGGGVPQPTPDTLYFIFLPSGVVSDLQGAQSCKQQCGYHEDIDGKIFYALIPHAACAGCTRKFSLFDSLTRVSSHELCEAITDPSGQGWYTHPPDGSPGEEIGDLCSEGTKQLGIYKVQTEFSNQTGGCL